MIVDVRRAQAQLEADFIDRISHVSDQYAGYEPTRLTAMLNKTSHQCADQMMRTWTRLDHFLLMKYIDGNIKRTNPDQTLKTTPTGVVAGPQQPPYPQWFYEGIVRDRGTLLQVREQ